MPLIEDIPSDPEPKGESTTSTPAMRGHQAAIHMAVTALRAAGLLRPGMRACRRDRLIQDWIEANVDPNGAPSRWAIKRYFRLMGEV